MILQKPSEEAFQSNTDACVDVCGYVSRKIIKELNTEDEQEREPYMFWGIVGRLYKQRQELV